jgi:protein TonB
VAGDAGQAQAPSLSQGKLDDLTATWGASIRARIEKRKRYPSAADGASGTVTVRLTIARSGALTGLSIVGSSGNPALDEAAKKAVRSAGRFPAAPKGLPQDSYNFTLPMRFSR